LTDCLIAIRLLFPKSQRIPMALNVETLAIIFGVAVFVLVFGSLGVGVVLVVRDTVRRKGKWGMNFGGASCPLCGTTAPTVRAPQNLDQMLWGGCTCKNCGLEYDKWGHAVNEAERQRRLDEIGTDSYDRQGLGRRSSDDHIQPPDSATH
jgi:hypothetical protein